MMRAALHRGPGAAAVAHPASAIGTLAVRSLWLELATWPKPGLVSPVDNGSHPDMNAALLRRSALALQPYFTRLAEAGAAAASMPALRRIGLQAEAAMLRATGGINTHRGAIFGLGLLCAAAGRTSAWRTASPALGEVVRAHWGAAIQAGPLLADSHGSRVRQRYGSGGASAEAAAGFPHLYGVGLPALRRARQLVPGHEAAARVHSCFALIAALEDTNLLYRGGPQGLAFARALAAAFIERGGVGGPGWLRHAWAAHRAFVARNLSPGGSADLLAMTVFADSWQRSSARPRARRGDAAHERRIAAPAPP